MHDLVIVVIILSNSFLSYSPFSIDHPQFKSLCHLYNVVYTTISHYIVISLFKYCPLKVFVTMDWYTLLLVCCMINVRETRRDNQEWTMQSHIQHWIQNTGQTKSLIQKTEKRSYTEDTTKKTRGETRCFQMVHIVCF